MRPRRDRAIIWVEWRRKLVFDSATASVSRTTGHARSKRGID
jgi:hypothetical protein